MERGGHQLHLPVLAHSAGAMSSTEYQYTWTHPEGPFKNVKKTMIRLANLNPRIFNDSQTQLRHHSYEVPSKPAGHLRPECASLTTCTNDGKAKRQQGLLPNTLLLPGEAGSDPGLTPRCPDPLSQTFCFVRSKFLGRCLDSVWSLSRTLRVISNRNINFKST